MIWNYIGELSMCAMYVVCVYECWEGAATLADVPAATVAHA